MNLLRREEKLKKLSVKSFVAIGMLSSLSFLLMMIKFPIPPFPAWLSVDFSDIPALIAALLFGPIAAVLVELFKNILDYVMSGSEAGLPIGNMANFLAGITFVLPTYFVYNRLKTKKGLVVSLITGITVMSVIMSILNYFFILPAYIYLLGYWDPMSTSALRQLVVAAILPFNLIKGLIVAVIFILLYNRMKGWIDKQLSYRGA
ncbi:ECF transporter S component [Bacillus sp. FJAT-50079]|uniref:ECF transporter S component n=1 Tax=Bacillus sp. FJAT-50079 TaxID=2833577 RepID=UPI001BC91454|nr:ECF transporter S component [Bacillus sp. FJAT-50079]MBS4209724.1 ECF transporter S component [Bacillus sp. FJAT-50079]